MTPGGAFVLGVVTALVVTAAGVWMVVRLSRDDLGPRRKPMGPR